MIYILHRDNYFKHKDDNRFDIEVDVWVLSGKYFIGHSKPSWRICETNLFKDNIWVHAKNIEAFYHLYGRVKNLFFHQKDEMALTTSGYVWTYIGKPLTPMSIAVLPERANYDIKELKQCAGICSDNLEFYMEIFG